METTLHRSLKHRYAAGEDDRQEVRVGGFRIDAIDQAGRLVEIQSGALGPLCWKLERLLPQHRLRVVKPVVLSRRLVRTSARGGSVVSVRRSPKRGSLVDIFDDLVGLVRAFPHTNLDIEILGVTIDEVRIPRRRRPGYAVADRRLGEIQETAMLPRAISGRSCPRPAMTASRSRQSSSRDASNAPSGLPSAWRIVCGRREQPALWAKRAIG